MGQIRDGITPELRAFIEAQPLFFVATAPLSGSGHVNLSPKGLDTLRVLSSDRVAYLDLTGSGNETAAHATENGRITLMFCAFSGSPRILRLFGRASVALPGSAPWRELTPRFPAYPGARQIIVADITRVQTSCGYAVPRMDLVQQRDTLVRWAAAKGDGLRDYRRQKNATSIDGLAAPLEVGEGP
jgi:hypothetical protein